MAKKPIESLRREIDSIDDRILELLEKRAERARRIGEAKSKDGATVYVPSREKKILDRVSKKRRLLPGSVVRAIFREVISACRGLERGLRVSYFGPAATYSHLAARRHFGAGADLSPMPSIPQVFEEVERGRADYGVVPIENSTEGSVTYTLDRFLESPLRIAAEIQIEVSHCLLSRERDRPAIRKILSHPQALAQCRRWIAANFPDVSVEEAPSTARAAERAAAEPGTAAIASAMAAEVYGLRTLAESVQDVTFNATRFVVIGREDSERASGDDKTSAVFFVRDQVGVLQRLLEPFAKNRINLTRIESRPLKGRAWEYVFVLDFLGHRRERRVAATLDALEEICTRIQVLGSYPVWRND